MPASDDSGGHRRKRTHTFAAFQEGILPITVIGGAGVFAFIKITHDYFPSVLSGSDLTDAVSESLLLDK